MAENSSAFKNLTNRHTLPVSPSKRQGSPKKGRNGSPSKIPIKTVDPELSDEGEISGYNERDIELDNLKTIIVALNQKVKSKEDLESEIELMRERIEDQDKERVIMQQRIEESSNEIKELQVKNQRFQELIIQENKNWANVDLDKEKIIKEKDEEINRLKQLLN